MRRLCFYAVLLALLLASVRSGAFEAGAARYDITGPLGAPMNGYGDRMGRGALSVHDPLWARALYLDDGETKVFLVTSDLCVIDPELRARVIALAPVEVPRENIILTATHTHNAQGGMCKRYPIRLVSGRYMPEVLEATARGIAQSMREAYEGRRRAVIGYGTARQTALSSNRRDPAGPIDHQIGVILVEDPDGHPIAIVASLAAHPTSIGDEDRYAYSADYPGFFYSHLEELAGEGCVALFMNGAQGNQTIGNPEGKAGWERTESIGRLLAVRVKEAVNGIVCGEAILRTASATPTLPRSLASFLPDRVLLQTLEIDDLLLTFLPGEPCVEIGLELRRRALERGYTAHIPVGLANDYLMYFIPRAFYAHSNYENAMNFFGPRIEDWFYREFSRLMRPGEAESEPELLLPAPVLERGRTLHLVLEGDAYRRGAMRGKAFAEDIRIRFDSRVVEAVRSGALQPKTGLWAYWPPFLDPSPLALPAMAIAARPLLDGVSDGLFAEIEGMAEGAGLPFDALWLLQNAAQFSAREDKEALFQTPLCTMFAALGDRAGDDGLLVGRNLDWAGEELPVIVETRPDQGRRFIQAGFTWNAGVFSGMNDAGLVLCIERVSTLGSPGLKGAPAEMVLRDLLQSTETFDSAVDRLKARNHLRGYHVLVAGIDRKGAWRAAMIAYGNSIVVSEAQEGLLLGADPERDSLPEDTGVRYRRAGALLEKEPVVSVEALQRILSDTELGRSGTERILNPLTRHSVVFAPKALTLYVAIPGPDGSMGPYQPFTIEAGEARGEGVEETAQEARPAQAPKAPLQRAVRNAGNDPPEFSESELLGPPIEAGPQGGGHS
jgi:neutral ceramidase